MGVWDSLSEAFLLLRLGVCLGLELVFAWQWTFHFVLTRSSWLDPTLSPSIGGQKCRVKARLGGRICKPLSAPSDCICSHITSSSLGFIHSDKHSGPLVLGGGQQCTESSPSVHISSQTCPSEVLLLRHFGDVDVAPCKRRKLLD